MVASSRAAAVELQRRANRSTEDAWERFAPHRARVMALVPAVGAKRVAVLGAGNCNDVDLAVLAGTGAELHLVDVDEPAVREALARQPHHVQRRCHAHALDLSGVLDLLEAWREALPRPGALEGLGERVARDLVATVGEVDVALSSGVLSQIAWTCKERLGADHPALDAVAQAAALAHVRGAAALPRPGGAVVLVVDSVSTDRHQIEELVAASDAASVLRSLAAAGACYPGTHPDMVERALSATPGIASVRRRGAWVWQVTDDRAHLVYALVARRRAQPAGG